MKLADAVSQKPAKVTSAQSKPEFIESDERNGDERTVNKVVNQRIKTLAELAEVCEINTDEWEIYRWKCGAWQTGMKPPAVGCGGATSDKCDEGHHPWHRDSDEPIYSQQFVVQAWMRLKKVLIAARSELDALRAKALEHTPQYPKPLKRTSGSGILAEYSLSDHHFGALIWGQETGGDDYDTRLARIVWEQALSYLIQRSDGFQPDEAMLVLGNDQQNADNRGGTTERGTPQTMDSRYQKVFSVSRDASIWAIDTLLSKYKKVRVVMVPGNHDPLSTWHLGDSLISWYRQCNRVTIDNRPLFRKYCEYGVNMLLFVHGHGGKLEDYGKTMAAEQAEMWGRTKWREAHTGDKHHRRVIELSGATVRILPSLRPPDAWSSENNHVGSIRAAEAYLWSETEGLIGTSVFSVPNRAMAKV